jgi:hypothetical protein
VKKQGFPCPCHGWLYRGKGIIAVQRRKHKLGGVQSHFYVIPVHGEIKEMRNAAERKRVVPGGVGRKELLANKRRVQSHFYVDTINLL